jgi:two-component system, OmpR family, sensor histidine kinase VicK
LNIILIEPANTADIGRQEKAEEPSERTEILHGAESILNFIVPRYALIKRSIDACFDYAGPSLMTTTEPIWQELLKCQKRGVKIRLLTDIEKDNVIYCKKFLTLRNSELRHLDNVKGNFGIADRKECLEHAASNEGEPATHAIFTTVRGIVESRLFLFDNLWKKGITAEDRIKEIEEDIQPPFTETIRDPLEINRTVFKLMKSAKREIQIMLSTAGEFLTSEDTANGNFLKLLAHKIRDENNLNVRMLIPDDDNKNNAKLTLESYLKQVDNKIVIQYLDPRSQTNFSILIIDSKYLLVLEYEDPEKEIFKPAEIATYSNSEAMVMSYSSIFEKLWLISEINKL